MPASNSTPQLGNSRRSIFDITNANDPAGYIKRPDSSLLEHKNSAYLRLSNVDEHFWELLITKFTETHAEKYTLQESLAEGVILYAGGSSPVQVTIEGVLPSGKDLDYRVRFLRRYIMEFRERRLAPQARTLQVHIRHTLFTLQIESFIMSESADMSDFTSISITGIAHHFNTDDGELLEYISPSNTAAVSSSTPAAAKMPEGTTLSTVEGRE